jgi:hypothetical protein
MFGNRGNLSERTSCMNRAAFVVVTSLAAALAVAQAPPPSAPAVTAAAPAAVGAKGWIGRYAEFEDYLRQAPIERQAELPVGVTKSDRVFFAPGGLAASATAKHLPMGRRGGFWEAHNSEIAAYELDRVLGLDMVPPTVERRVGTDVGSLQLWVEGCRVIKDVDQSACPNPTAWAKQALRQKVFDNLIANIDRNAGNILVDGEWNMVLIDHSRAFASNTMPFEKQTTRIDRAFFEKLKALDEATLMKRVRPWLMSDGQARDILKRRDKIVAYFEKEARKRGEAAVFPF